MLVTGECGKDAIDLVSNHEQTDTKVTLLAKHALDESRNNVLWLFCQRIVKGYFWMMEGLLKDS